MNEYGKRITRILIHSLNPIPPSPQSLFGVEFNAPLDTIQVISEAVFTANHLTDRQTKQYRKIQTNSIQIRKSKQPKIQQSPLFGNNKCQISRQTDTSASTTRASRRRVDSSSLLLQIWNYWHCSHIGLVAWHGSRVVSVLDSGAAEGPGLKSQPRRCRVTVLGKLVTPIRV